jgi:hypothetical protein
MLFSTVLVSLLPLLGAALAAPAEEQLDSLPVLNKLPNSEVYELAGNDAFKSDDVEVEASSKAVCPPNYPWLCNGRCCPYSKCCTRQCCSPQADFCSNGLCYRWT